MKSRGDTVSAVLTLAWIDIIRQLWLRNEEGRYYVALLLPSAHCVFDFKMDSYCWDNFVLNCAENLNLKLTSCVCKQRILLR